MRSRLFRTVAAGLLAGSLLISAVTSAFADPRNFTVINQSPDTVLTHLYVSASDVKSWEEDILGKDVLAPGESWDILFSKFDGEAGKCLYDIKVTTKEGAEAFLYKVDLCTTTTVTYGG